MFEIELFQCNAIIIGDNVILDSKDYHFPPFTSFTFYLNFLFLLWYVVFIPVSDGLEVKNHTGNFYGKVQSSYGILLVGFRCYSGSLV